MPGHGYKVSFFQMKAARKQKGQEGQKRQKLFLPFLPFLPFLLPTRFPL